MTQTGVVIFARMGSSRLPGKSLTDLGGRVVLGRLIDRMAGLKETAKLIVATSDQPADDAIQAFCETDDTCRRLGIEVFRGDHLDVLGRARAAADYFDIDPLVRLSGDSPFMDAAVVDQVIRRLLDTNPDITTNRFPPTFPPGITVEAVSRACLAHTADTADAPEDREHVTTFIYDNAASFHIENVAASRAGLRDFALTVDTAEDLARARALAGRLEALGDPLDHLSAVEQLMDMARTTQD